MEQPGERRASRSCFSGTDGEGMPRAWEVTCTRFVGEDKAPSFRKVLQDNWKGKLGAVCSGAQVCSPAWPDSFLFPSGWLLLCVCAPAGWGEMFYLRLII